MIFERWWWWFRTSFLPPSDSGSMVTGTRLKAKFIFRVISFLWYLQAGRVRARARELFIFTTQFIWLWSAIWISSSVFVVTFFCPFFIIFHSSQRQSILLPVKWPCIFLVHLICLHFFCVVSDGFTIPSVSFSSVLCYGFSIHCQFSFTHFTLPFIHPFNRTWSKMLIQICSLSLSRSSAFYIFQSFNYSFRRLHDFDHAISYASLIIITCNVWNKFIDCFSQLYFVCVSVCDNERKQKHTLKSRSRKLQLRTKSVSKINK